MSRATNSCGERCRRPRSDRHEVTIHELLRAEHRRLSALLKGAAADFERFDHEAFEAFRAGLLRHIDFAVRTFAAWRLGRKGHNDRLALFILARNRRSAVEVGYGLSGLSGASSRPSSGAAGATRA